MLLSSLILFSTKLSDYIDSSYNKSPTKLIIDTWNIIGFSILNYLGRIKFNFIILSKFISILYSKTISNQSNEPILKDFLVTTHEFSNHVLACIIKLLFLIF